MNPKLFISYSWSSEEHGQLVIDLATSLRESGVDVILDKWDLREGNDATAFMEKMVTAILGFTNMILKTWFIPQIHTWFS